jgi:histidinol dehydrogenase
LRIYVNPRKGVLEKILTRPKVEQGLLNDTVLRILADVRRDGDVAVRRFGLQFDQVLVSEFAVGGDELLAAGDLLSSELKLAIETAKNNIERFHKSQKSSPKVVETMPGVRCWRKNIGIERVGLYIPGGTAPLFSTVLMLGVPAYLAGCREVVLCTPPMKDGRVHPAILYAAQLAKIKKIYKIGGVQAIGSMAYGTKTVPRVDKIFGPGNQYVTAAKQLVNAGGVAIDMPAGPSEVLVVADESANPAFVAADLLSQAEHGADSQVVLVAYSESMVERTLVELDLQVKRLPRMDLAEKALLNSVAIVVKNGAEAMKISNQYAPEHLILATDDAVKLANRVVNAGSVFIGHFSPESVGDYASGTNHTLPTNGHARAYSGVSLDSFVKKVTFQALSREGLQNIAETVVVMAEAESLRAHAEAVRIRVMGLE